MRVRVLLARERWGEAAPWLWRSLSDCQLKPCWNLPSTVRVVSVGFRAVIIAYRLCSCCILLSFLGLPSLTGRYWDVRNKIVHLWARGGLGLVERYVHASNCGWSKETIQGVGIQYIFNMYNPYSSLLLIHISYLLFWLRYWEDSAWTTKKAREYAYCICSGTHQPWNLEW